MYIGFAKLCSSDFFAVDYDEKGQLDGEDFFGGEFRDGCDICSPIKPEDGIQPSGDGRVVNILPLFIASAGVLADVLHLALKWFVELNFLCE